jgi:hypothetical protein
MATDQFDYGIDVITAPPGLDFYPYFELATLPYYLDTDIRQWQYGPKANKEWHLNLKNIRSATTLSWSASNFPTTGYFKISGQNFSWDMRAHQTIAIHSDDLLKIKYFEQVDFTFDFPAAGWYLISLPITPQDNALKTLFPEALTAFAYENNSYIPASQIMPGKGYWILISKPMRVVITGLPFQQYTVSYPQGWSLIGSVKDTVYFSNPNDNPDGSIIVCYQWDKNTNYYRLVFPNGTEKLIPGEGYWIAAMNAGTLTLGYLDSQLRRHIAAAPEFFIKADQLPPFPPDLDNTSEAVLTPVENLAIHNFPNPFNATTKIIYSLPKAGPTRIFIYNALGQLVKILLNSSQPEGVHHLFWEGDDENGLPVGNGLYFCRIEHLGMVKIQKMVVLK